MGVGGAGVAKLGVGEEGDGVFEAGEGQGGGEACGAGAEDEGGEEGCGCVGVGGDWWGWHFALIVFEVVD